MLEQYTKSRAMLRRNPTLSGAVAGLVATVPMTIFMLVMHRVLPKWQQYALPPEEIVKEGERRAHMKGRRNKKQILGTSLVSHLGYGMMMGAVYNSLTTKVPLPAALKGVLFGLVVWAASYLGWLPLAGFSAAATDEPLRRNIVMIIAHVIWGSATGIGANLLK